MISSPPTDGGVFASRMQENTATHPTAHTLLWEHATRCLLPRSVLVDHMTVLLFLCRPNGGGLAIASALATAG